LRFDFALGEVEAVVRAANKFFDAAKPWTLKKSDPEAMRRVLAVALELLRCVAIAYQPFVPVAAARVLDQIGVPDTQRAFSHIADEPGVPAGAPIATPRPIFPRIVVDEDDDASSSSGGSTATPQPQQQRQATKTKATKENFAAAAAAANVA